MVRFQRSDTTLAFREFLHEVADMHIFEGSGQIVQDLIGPDGK